MFDHCGLLVLICGEFTPLVVLAFPKLTPLTCRIPKQIAKLRETARQRRESSLRKLQYTDPAAWDKMASGHVLRSLGLGMGVWDKIGVDPPFAKSRAERALKRVVEDDFRIRQGGGVRYLEEEEVIIACEDRAIHTSITPVADLRKQLHQWVSETTTKDQKPIPHREIISRGNMNNDSGNLRVLAIPVEQTTLTSTVRTTN